MPKLIIGSGFVEEAVRLNRCLAGVNKHQQCVIDQLRQDRSSLNSQLVEARAERQHGNGDEAARQELKDELHRLKVKLGTLEAEKVSAKRELDNCQHNLEATVQNLQTAQTVVRQQQQDGARQEGRLRTVQDQAKELTQQCDALIHSRDAATTLVTQLRDTLAENENKWAGQAGEWERGTARVKEELLHAEDSLKRAEDERQRLDARLQETTQLLSDAQARLNVERASAHLQTDISCFATSSRTVQTEPRPDDVSVGTQASAAETSVAGVQTQPEPRRAGWCQTDVVLTAAAQCQTYAAALLSQAAQTCPVNVSEGWAQTDVTALQLAPQHRDTPLRPQTDIGNSRNVSNQWMSHTSPLSQGPENLLARGPEELRSYVPDDLRSRGSENSHSHRPENLRSYVPDDLHSRGPENLRSYVPDDLHSRGPENLRSYVPDDLHSRGPENLRSYVPDDLHSRGPENLLSPRLDNLRSSGPENIVSLGLDNPRSEKKQLAVSGLLSSSADTTPPVSTVTTLKEARSEDADIKREVLEAVADNAASPLLRWSAAGDLMLSPTGLVPRESWQPVPRDYGVLNSRQHIAQRETWQPAPRDSRVVLNSLQDAVMPDWVDPDTQRRMAFDVARHVGSTASSSLAASSTASSSTASSSLAMFPPDKRTTPSLNSSRHENNAGSLSSSHDVRHDDVVKSEPASSQKPLLGHEDSWSLKPQMQNPSCGDENRASGISMTNSSASDTAPPPSPLPLYNQPSPQSTTSALSNPSPQSTTSALSNPTPQSTTSALSNPSPQSTTSALSNPSPQATCSLPASHLQSVTLSSSTSSFAGMSTTSAEAYGPNHTMVMLHASAIHDDRAATCNNVPTTIAAVGHETKAKTDALLGVVPKGTKPTQSHEVKTEEERVGSSAGRVPFSTSIMKNPSSLLSTTSSSSSSFSLVSAASPVSGNKEGNEESKVMPNRDPLSARNTPISSITSSLFSSVFFPPSSSSSSSLVTTASLSVGDERSGGNQELGSTVSGKKVDHSARNAPIKTSTTSSSTASLFSTAFFSSSPVPPPARTTSSSCDQRAGTQQPGKGPSRLSTKSRQLPTSSSLLSSTFSSSSLAPPTRGRSGLSLSASSKSDNKNPSVTSSLISSVSSPVSSALPSSARGVRSAERGRGRGRGSGSNPAAAAKISPRRTALPFSALGKPISAPSTPAAARVLGTVAACLTGQTEVKVAKTTKGILKEPQGRSAAKDKTVTFSIQEKVKLKSVFESAPASAPQEGEETARDSGDDQLLFSDDDANDAVDGTTSEVGRQCQRIVGMLEDGAVPVLSRKRKLPDTDSY